MADKIIIKNPTSRLRLVGTKTIREPGFGNNGTRTINTYQEVPKINLNGRQLISFLLCFLFMFTLPRLHDYLLEYGNVEDRTYSQNAVEIIDGEVLIDSESFDSFESMEIPLMTLSESLEFFDSVSTVFNPGSLIISYDVWEAKNLPWLASWGRVSIDDLNIISIFKTFGYWMISVFTRIWYIVVVRFAFIPDLINITFTFLFGEPVFLPSGVA